MVKIQIALAFILLLLILMLPPAKGYDSYLDILRHTSMTLKGQAPYSDVAQDFYGFIALMTNQDPYALLGSALKTIGVHWKASFSSTHPPTAFLLVAPVALLPWPISSMAWAWIMLIFIILSIKVDLEYSWSTAILISVIWLFWPPIATSFDQITIVWLSGLAFAFKYRNSKPFYSGLLIGVASFTKLLPVVLLLPFLLRRKWDAVAGFVLSWLAAFGILVILSPKTIIGYFVTNRTNAIDIISQMNNSSFLFFLYRKISMPGLFLTVVAILTLFLFAYKKYRQEPDKKISNYEWNIYAFMAVLLLPIAWIFSVAPLVPNLLSLMQNKRLLIRVLAICSIIPPLIVPPWGVESTIGIFSFFVISGTAFLLAESDYIWLLKKPDPTD